MAQHPGFDKSPVLFCVGCRPTEILDQGTQPLPLDMHRTGPLCAPCHLPYPAATLLLLPADKDPATGTDTVGSSEAVLLGGLALKRRWQERRKAAGLDISKPNIVMGTETHVVGSGF